MALDADDLAAIREHVGSTPPDADLEVQWDRLGSVEAVALAVLRGRLADLLASPADLRVDGDYSESWGKNLDLLRAKIAALETLLPDGPGAVKVAHLSRSGRSR